MKQPITVTVHREHANAGDVIMTLTNAFGDVANFAVPGDCTPFTALRALVPFLELALSGVVDGRAKHDVKVDPQGEAQS